MLATASAAGRVSPQGILMKRSKLEMYVDVLKALKRKGSMSPTRVMYEVNACFMYIEEYLGFLVRYQLVEKKVLSKRRVLYAITEKGITLLKAYEELEKALPITDGKAVEKDLLKDAKDRGHPENTRKTQSSRTKLSVVLGRPKSS